MRCCDCAWGINCGKDNREVKFIDDIKYTMCHLNPTVLEKKPTDFCSHFKLKTLDQPANVDLLTEEV